MHRHPPQFAIGIGLAGGGEHGLVCLVRVAADAEHVLLVAVEIALGEALPGKGLFQQLHLLCGGLAVLPQGLAVDPGDDGGVFRPLHPSLDLQAGHPRLLQLLQPVGQAAVLQAQGMLVHAAGEGIGHAAGLGTHAPVAAAPSDEGGHVTLAGVAEAQRAVAEDLRLNAGMLGDKTDLLQAQLPGQHGSRQAKLRRRFHAGKIM